MGERDTLRQNIRKLEKTQKQEKEIFRDRWQLLDTHHYWLPVTEPPHTWILNIHLKKCRMHGLKNIQQDQ